MKGYNPKNVSRGLDRLNTLWIGAVLLPAWVEVSAMASPLQLESIPGAGFAPAAGGAGDSTLPIISRDGRFVLFASTANNLVSVGANEPLPAVVPAPLNVFLRDRSKQTTVLISANRTGTGGGDADSIPIGVSTNGRYALFESSASNLVAGDTNNAGDVFLRDTRSGVTRLLSAAANGGFGDNSSYNSAMTPDGRYVAFASAASNLIAGDTNGIPDVFIRDMESGVTTLVSVGAQFRTNNLTVESDAPALTPDGRYVLFYSTAGSLALGVQTIGDLFVRDRVSGTITWVSSGAKPMLSTLASVTNSVSFNAALSDDGQFVAFEAIAYPKLSPSVILRYNLQTGQTELVETNAVGFSGNYESIQDLGMTPDGRFVTYVANVSSNSDSTTAIRVWDAQTGSRVLASGDLNNSVTDGALSDLPSISDDGRFVGFISDALDLVTNIVNGDFQVYVRDLQTAKTTLVTADTNGIGSALDTADGLTMSADGRVIGFDSQDSSLVPGDSNQAYDVFLRDLNHPEVELISSHDPGLSSLTADGSSFCSTGGLSSDARFLAFWSEADDLIANDTNGQRDVFVRDRVGGTTSLVSINTNGAVADGFSTDPAMSASGRFIAFTSFADDLVADDTNRWQDVFLRDSQAGTTVLVSVNAAGTGPGDNDSYSPLLSADRQSVLFRSRAGNLTTTIVFPPIENLFWRDLRSNRTYALTTNGVGTAAITPDGAVVAYTAMSGRFVSSADRLSVWSSQSNTYLYSLSGGGFSSVAISPNGQLLAYVTNDAINKRLIGVDRVQNTNFPIASYVLGSPTPLRFDSSNRYLAYVGMTGAMTNVTQVYLYDFQTGSNRLISQSYDGVSPGNDDSDSIDIGPGGRFIAYRSAASNLVPGDTNGLADVFLYDGVSGVTSLVSANRVGSSSGNNRSLTPVVSGDGQTLVFTSWASDLVQNDFNNNADIFSLSLSEIGVIPNFAVQAWADPDTATTTWLSWPVVTGKPYRVQFKDHLNDAAWQDLGGNVSVMGGRGYLPDQRGQTSSSRFYRVIAN